MKRLFPLFAFLALAVSTAFADTTNRMAIRVKYQNADGTREVSVVVPATVKNQHNYFRAFVRAYISEWNNWLSDQAFVLKAATTPQDVKKRSAYKAEQLVPFEDADDIAAEDKVKDDQLAQIGNNREMSTATLDAKSAVKADLKTLRKKVQS